MNEGRDSDSDHDLTINLEAYGDSSSAKNSSDELRIVTDIDEIIETRKRKRGNDQEDNEDGDDEGGAADSDYDADMPKVVQEMEEEIQRQLDAKAKRSNLTISNVKDILKDIITNEHVLDMVHQTMVRQERNFYFSKVFQFTPKLTRAKTRELLKTCPSMVWPITPSKCPSTSKCKVLIEQELAEDSSDEEYKPNDDDDDDQGEKEKMSLGEEEEDDNKEAGDDEQGDTEDAEDVEEEHGDTGDVEDNEDLSDSEEDENEESSRLEKSYSSHMNSIDRVTGEDSTTDNEVSLRECTNESEKNNEKEANSDPTPSTPLLDNQPTKKVSFEIESVNKETTTENIGQRTRSKFSLSDTPLELIESAFVPPDITTDMYDSECDDEDWKSFLKGFNEPLKSDANDAPDDDDDETDPEYNILADEEEMEDKEELRADPGVQVSRKEVNALMMELFEYIGMLDDNPKKGVRSEHSQQNMHELNMQDSVLQDIAEHLAGAFGDEGARASECTFQNVKDTSKGACSLLENLPISDKQRLLIDQHMRKHVQLLTQHFMLSYLHPLCHEESSKCKQNLNTLKYLAGQNSSSAFQAANLDDAICLVDEWEKLYAVDEKKEQCRKHFEKEMEKAHYQAKYRKCYFGEFTEDFLHAVCNSNVFLYPLLLPIRQFRFDCAETKFFVPSEDNLIAIGLEQFYKDAAGHKQSKQRIIKLIYEHLVPTKSPDVLKLHIRKCKAKESNPINYYYTHNIAPPSSHFVIPFKELIKPPLNQPLDLLPEVWREYIKSQKKCSKNHNVILLY